MAIKARGLTILLFLIAAIFFYAIGNITGLMFLLIIGGVFELLFWSKLFRKTSSTS